MSLRYISEIFLCILCQSKAGGLSLRCRDLGALCQVIISSSSDITSLQRSDCLVSNFLHSCKKYLNLSLVFVIMIGIMSYAFTSLCKAPHAFSRGKFSFHLYMISFNSCCCPLGFGCISWWTSLTLNVSRGCMRERAKTYMDCLCSTYSNNASFHKRLKLYKTKILYSPSRWFDLMDLIWIHKRKRMC